MWHSFLQVFFDRYEYPKAGADYLLELVAHLSEDSYLRQLLAQKFDDYISGRIQTLADVNALLEEIKALLASGIPASCTAMQAIGYKEFVEALNGNCTIEEAADLVRQSSRRYAKRQLTWLRRNEKIHWLTRRTGQSSEEILAQARRVILDFDN